MAPRHVIFTAGASFALGLIGGVLLSVRFPATDEGNSRWLAEAEADDAALHKRLFELLLGPISDEMRAMGTVELSWLWTNLRIQQQWLKPAFVRLHGLLFDHRILPMGWGSNRGILGHPCSRQTCPDNTLSRYGFTYFFRGQAHLVSNGSTCLAWDTADLLTNLFPACTHRWAYRHVSGVAVNAHQARGVVLGDLNLGVSNQSNAGMFDLVLANQVFEHVAHPYDAARTLLQLLRPGGLLLWTAPFMERYHLSPSDYFRYTANGAASLFATAGFQLEVMKTIGNSRITSGYVMGFGTGDFGVEYLEKNLLGHVGLSQKHGLLLQASKKLNEHSRYLYLSVGLVARRPQ